MASNLSVEVRLDTRAFQRDLRRAERVLLGIRYCEATGCSAIAAEYRACACGDLECGEWLCATHWHRRQRLALAMLALGFALLVYALVGRWLA